MTTSTNPVLHVPAHKQTNPAAQPGQIVNRIDGLHPAMGAPYGTRTGRFTSAVSNIEEVPRNVWVQAVKQDKGQAK